MTNRTEFTRFQETAFNLLTGQPSKFTPTDDGGYVVYVKQRLAVDEAKMKEELPGYLTKMREQRQVAAFEQWFGREMQLHLVPPASERNQPVG
jgi:parvulin-like peptidyl-prolyl isomerase